MYSKLINTIATTENFHKTFLLSEFATSVQVEVTTENTYRSATTTAEEIA